MCTYMTVCVRCVVCRVSGVTALESSVADESMASLRFCPQPLFVTDMAGVPMP